MFFHTKENSGKGPEDNKTCHKEPRQHIKTNKPEKMLFLLRHFSIHKTWSHLDVARGSKNTDKYILLSRKRYVSNKCSLGRTYTAYHNITTNYT